MGDADWHEHRSDLFGKIDVLANFFREVLLEKNSFSHFGKVFIDLFECCD